MTRIDEGMIQVKNAHPKDFKLEALDKKLVCMAMIWVFLSEFVNNHFSERIDQSQITQVTTSEKYIFLKHTKTW